MGNLGTCTSTLLVGNSFLNGEIIAVGWSISCDSVFNKFSLGTGGAPLLVPPIAVLARDFKYGN
jgi:hypothetical protein